MSMKQGYAFGTRIRLSEEIIKTSKMYQLSLHKGHLRTALTFDPRRQPMTISQNSRSLKKQYCLKQPPIYQKPVFVGGQPSRFTPHFILQKESHFKEIITICESFYLRRCYM